MKNNKIKYIGICFLCILLIAIITSISHKIISNKKEANKIVAYINDIPINQVTYDYYFNSYYNSYVSNYAFLFSYMDIDENSDIMPQMYDDERTYGEYFKDCALDQIVKITALNDDGHKNNFSYDEDEEFNRFYEQIKLSCKNANTNPLEYFKKFYGKYANKKNIEKLLKYGFYSSAYYDYLCKNMNLSENDQTAFNYVQDLKKNYEIKEP